MLFWACKPAPKPLQATEQSIATKAGATTAPQWMDGFERLRRALHQHDTVNVKSFFKFPIYNTGNEIWYLIYGDNETALSQMPYSLKPFTEADFHQFYAKLFPPPFLRTLQTTMPDSLRANHFAETPTLAIGNTQYVLQATADTVAKTLTLNLLAKTKYDQDGDAEVGEFSTIYVFNIVDNQLLFKEIRIAG